MAFDNVTLFELHFDDAQFGPGAVPGTDEPSERAPEAEQGSGRGRVLALVALSIGVSLVAAAVARRVVGDGERLDIEALGDVEPIPER